MNHFLSPKPGEGGVCPACSKIGDSVHKCQKKKQKTRFCDPKLGGGKLVRFLEFDHFGSKPGGEVGSFTSAI